MNGVYIVYLLSSDANSMYLTFNQGFTEIASNVPKSETIKRMRAIASNLINKLDKHSFNSDENINLGSNLTNRAEMYQLGTIFYKQYIKQNLPSEEQLRTDLKEMLEIYEDYYNKIFNVEKSDSDKTLKYRNEGVNMISKKIDNIISFIICSYNSFKFSRYYWKPYCFVFSFKPYFSKH